MALNQSRARQPLIVNNNITILSDHHHPIMHFSCVWDEIAPLSEAGMDIQWLLEHVSGVGHMMLLHRLVTFISNRPHETASNSVL